MGRAVRENETGLLLPGDDAGVGRCARADLADAAGGAARHVRAPRGTTPRARCRPGRTCWRKICCRIGKQAARQRRSRRLSMARILLLIPHPDDEVVGAAASIARRRAAGDRFFGLYLTDGDSGAGAALALGAARPRRRASRGGGTRRERRRRSWHRAAGVPRFPSRDAEIASRRSDSAISGEPAPTQAIDAIWVPAWEGGHQDHDVANFLAARAADGRPVIEFAEYNRGGGTVRGIGSHRRTGARPNCG